MKLRKFEINRRTIAYGLVFCIIATMLGFFLVKSVKTADVVLIQQQQEQKQVQHKHSLNRQQEADERTRAAQQEAAVAEKQAKLKAIEEEQLAWNRTNSDPTPPSGADKIKGEWWFSELTPNKAYLYIENVDSGKVEASLPGGATMSLRCAVMHSTDSSPGEDPSTCTGLSQSAHSWIRVSMGSTFKAGSRAPAEGWSLLWHEGDRVEVYDIQSFCDPKCSQVRDNAQELPNHAQELPNQKTRDEANQR